MRCNIWLQLALACPSFLPLRDAGQFRIRDTDEARREALEFTQSSFDRGRRNREASGGDGSGRCIIAKDCG